MHGFRMKVPFFILSLCALSASAQDLKIVDVDRTIDISTQLTKVKIALSLVNEGNAVVNNAQFLLTEDEQNHLAHITASVEKKNARIKKATTSPAGFSAYVIDVPKLAAGGKLPIVVEYVLVENLKPFPEEISQDETQYVVYTGNAYVSSSYPVDTQKTTILCGSGKILSFSNVASPAKQLGEKVVYGQYTNQPALAKVESRIHYENISPFIVATTVDRLIEISHWGNIAVEEKIQIVHKGARLSGPFSRLDFQLDRRGKKQPCVKEFKTVLPASARDVYYRDVIGNISSSAVKVKSESVEVDIRPRFPLFGGWKTNYVIGYNVPSYEYLYADGNKFALRLRLLDHIYDNMVVEKLTTKIVLPEKASDVKLATPYTVERRPNEKMATYLDTEGRPVIVIQKDNLIDAHIESFTLEYNWNRTNIWREPLIASAFFFCLFLAVIVYVRFDFEITKDSQCEARLGLAAKVDELHKVLNERNRLHTLVVDAVGKYKETKSETEMENAKKRIENERAELKKKITSICEEVKTLAPAANEKLAEIEKVESGLTGGEKSYIEKAMRTASKNTPEDRAWMNKINEAANQIDNILSGL